MASNTSTADPGARGRILGRWLVAAAIMAAIFVGSSIPYDQKPPDPFKYADKSQHFTAYALLGWALYRALRVTSPGKSGAFYVMMAIGIASFYGVTDEVHQIYVSGRQCEFLDWTADTIGASVAVGITHFLSLKGGSNK